MTFKAPEVDKLGEALPQFQLGNLVPSLSSENFSVYKATFIEGSQPVLLTVTSAELASSVGWTPDFMAKVKAFGSLRHPNLSTIVDCGTSSDGAFCFVAEDKESCPNLIQVRMGKPMDVPQALKLVRGLALALHLAHTKGETTYGLLSPMTIDMVHGEIAKIQPLRLTDTKVDEAMLPYLAPEVPESIKLSQSLPESADVYSLGMLLYFLLTGKHTAQANYVMPSCLCTCSEDVDLLVAKATHPNPPSRFASVIDLVTAIESALPKCTEKKLKAKPRASVLPSASQLSTQGKLKGIPVFYFYVLPALIIGIVLAYTALCYRSDMKAIRDDINKLVENNNKQQRFEKYKRDSERQKLHQISPDAVQVTPPATDQQTTPEKVTEGAVAAEDKTESTSPSVEIPEGLTNWCSESTTSAKTTSTFQELSAYDSAHAIDGDPSTICATGTDPKKESHINIDLGKGGDKSVEYIVIKLPEPQPQIGELTNFRIRLVNSSKEKVASKDFHTDGTSVKGTEVWKLDEPVSIRVIRIETLAPNAPLVVGEVEAYGQSEE